MRPQLAAARFRGTVLVELGDVEAVSRSLRHVAHEDECVVLASHGGCVHPPDALVWGGVLRLVLFHRALAALSRPTAEVREVWRGRTRRWSGIALEHSPYRVTRVPRPRRTDHTLLSS